MSTTPQVIWDQSSQVQWDDEKKTQPTTGPAPKKGLLGRLNDWYTKETDVANDPYAVAKGVLPLGGTQRESPRSAIGNTARMSTVPLLGPALGAPVATGLAIGGSVLGGKAGRWAGEQFDAPEIGEDVGGLMGGLLGGIAGPKSPGLARGAARKVLFDPITQKPTLSPGPILERFLRTPEEAQSMIAAQTPQPPKPEVFPLSRSSGPYRGPSSVPKSAPEVDPVLQAVREGRAAKLPTRMPPTMPPPRTSPFTGMTSSANPPADAELPLAPTAPSSPVQFVEKFGPRPSREVLGTQEPVSVFPEPRPLRPTDKPGYMSSVPREELPGLAQKGQPGAADVLGALGRPVLFEPRGSIGAADPEFGAMRERLLGANPSNPQPQLPQFSSASKANLATRPKAMDSPEWMAQQTDLEIRRLTDVLNNPRATAEERAIAQAQLNNYKSQ